jgi:hypothetical protein
LAFVPLQAQVVEPEPSSLLVEVTSPAEFIGFPTVCPGTSPDENQEEIICMAELYEARVKVLRHLGGATTKRRLTIRFTAHSFSAVWQRKVRFLIVAAPFEDKGSTGHFALDWDWEDKNGLFCRDEDDALQEDNLPLKRLYATRPAKVVAADTEGWSEGSRIICVTGNEVLRD